MYFRVNFLICLPRTECSVSCGGGHRSRVRQAALGVRCRRVFKGPEVLPRLRQFSHKQNVHLLPSSSCYLLLVVCCCSSSSSCLSLLLSVLTMSLWSLSTEWAVCARCSAQQPMVESRSLNSLKGTWSIKKKATKTSHFLSLSFTSQMPRCHGLCPWRSVLPCPHPLSPFWLSWSHEGRIGYQESIDGFWSLQSLWFTYVYICLRIASIVAFCFLQNQRTSMIWNDVWQRVLHKRLQGHTCDRLLQMDSTRLLRACNTALEMLEPCAEQVCPGVNLTQTQLCHACNFSSSFVCDFASSRRTGIGMVTIFCQESVRPHFLCSLTLISFEKHLLAFHCLCRCDQSICVDCLWEAWSDWGACTTPVTKWTCSLKRSMETEPARTSQKYMLIMVFVDVADYKWSQFDASIVYTDTR